ncbi:MAG: coniferyl aldehyde dehydrogenase [Gemmatimonadales bacterium]
MTDRDLRARFEAQRAAFAAAAPGYDRRMEALAGLRDALRAREEELGRAVAADFGHRSFDETRMLELFPLLDQIGHARRHLKGWMRRRRVRGTWFLWPSRAFVRYEPLGVVGVIGAWNYPVLLTLGPVVDALAAGNHVMVKPSERAPRTADVIAALLADTFPAEFVTGVLGGVEVARAFADLPFDHLLFTGSSPVAREVMRSAAANLTPVTLELGGKSPAIVHESYPLDLAVRRILTGKLYNAGQTCLAPDYVLLPAGREAAFEAASRRTVEEIYPDLAENPDYTHIVDDAHYERLRTLLEEAAAAGARLVPLAGAEAAATGAGEDAPAVGRVLPPTLVFGSIGGTRLMREEIFGPVLPVVAYRDLDEAIEFVARRPSPLALYYFDEDRARIERVLAGVQSGGVTIGDCVYQIGQRRLPFGGVGESGMGSYRGFDGFETFSHERGVMVQRRWAVTSLFRPPYTSRTRALVRWLLRLSRR